MPDEAMFLSADEVRELTGYKHSSNQMRWLSNHGWQYEVSRVGRPIVGRDYARQKMGFVAGSSSGRERPAPKMNLSAIKQAPRTGQSK